MRAPTDIEDRMTGVGSVLPSVRRQNWIDVLILAVVVLLGTVAVASELNPGISHLLGAAAVFGLVVVAFAGSYRRMMSRTDHVRALQSDSMLQIANESISYLRQGLDEDTAQAVCRIVLKRTEAASVAITDATRVLGFAGLGQDHHKVGGPIITRATQESLDMDEARVLHTKGEIGCPEPECMLRAAIVVPLEMRDRPVGTLKFYYVSDHFLNETQFAMAEGLARLLSTQLELSELERQTELATEMELKALQAQINPHFLFNTINTIASFIRTDPGKARELLRRFGTFYRRTLEQAEDLITVEREIEFVETYVELEQARFGNRLEMCFDVDPRAQNMPIPAFMIQPLVENSIGHGMRGDGKPLTVDVVVRVFQDELCIEVTDDGVGIPADRLPTILEQGAGKGLGIALRNVHDRLLGHFGHESAFEIDSTEGVGTTVRFRISPLPKPVAQHAS